MYHENQPNSSTRELTELETLNVFFESEKFTIMDNFELIKLDFLNKTGKIYVSKKREETLPASMSTFGLNKFYLS